MFNNNYLISIYNISKLTKCIIEVSNKSKLAWATICAFAFPVIVCSIFAIITNILAFQTSRTCGTIIFLAATDLLTHKKGFDLPGHFKTLHILQVLSLLAFIVGVAVVGGRISDSETAVTGTGNLCIAISWRDTEGITNE
jgi:hypothetical protein